MMEMVQAWGDQLARHHYRRGRNSHRAEPRRRALAYLHGLLSPCEHKNGWQLAEAIARLVASGGGTKG